VASNPKFRAFYAWLSNSRVNSYEFAFLLTISELTRKQTRFWSKLGRTEANLVKSIESKGYYF